MLLLQKAVNVFNMATRVVYRDRLVTPNTNKKTLFTGQAS
jgi:hypothetical protein